MPDGPYIVLLTDPRAPLGQLRVAVLSVGGKPTDKLSRAERFRTWMEASLAARGVTCGWTATVAPLDVDAVPALPWGPER